MVSLIYSEDVSSRFSATSPSNLILTSPLEAFQVSDVDHSFKKCTDAQHWCGYAVLDAVPAFLERSVMAIKGCERLGIVLFSTRAENTHFLFRDLNQQFRLINQDGHTTYMDEQLQNALGHFSNPIKH
jgi:hypothetical protein